MKLAPGPSVQAAAVEEIEMVAAEAEAASAAVVAAADEAVATNFFLSKRNK
jgi:hypothetical protein